MSDTDRILELHKRLCATLESITEYTEQSALERCPYRDRADLCTFSFGCRNQLPAGEHRRCSGVRLNIQKP